jgi:hypothetical protein
MTNKNQCKRFAFFVKILAIAALAFCLPAVAQEQNAWQFGSLPANSSISKPDDQQVYEILLKMLARWNAHDIEGFMEVYWKSPELFVIVDSEQFNGWQQLHDSYVHGYPGATRDGVHPTQPHSSAATQAGPRTRSNLVEHQFPEFPPEVGGEHHDELSKV